MAAKRMFSNSVIDSDAFCMLSNEAQLLYFHLGLKADDDGFVPVMRICRILGFDEKPLQELEKAGFLIAFENGVVVIVHWKINNELKKDRYHKSRYSSYKRRLRLNENGEYSIMEPERNQIGTKMEPEWNQDGNNSEERIAQRSPTQENQGYASPAHPTLDEIKAYCQEKALPADAQSFWETMERQGWQSKDGRRVEDWKVLLRSWGRGKAVKTVSAQRYNQRAYTEEELLAVSDDLIEEVQKKREAISREEGSAHDEGCGS